jgi:hypothetical protein
MYLMLPYTYLFFLGCCSSTQAPRVSGHLPMYPELLQSHLKLLISSKQLPFTQGLGCNNNIRTYPCYTRVRLQATIYCLHRDWTASNNIQFRQGLHCRQQYPFYTGFRLQTRLHIVLIGVGVQAIRYRQAIQGLDCNQQDIDRLYRD